MAKFKVLEKSFIGGRIVEAGAVVEVEFTDDGRPGSNLAAIEEADAAPKAKKKKAADSPDAPVDDLVG